MTPNQSAQINSSTNEMRQTPYLFVPKRFSDSRGWFSETYNETGLRELGIACQFIQDNQSYSVRKGTVRGLHFQQPPFAQAKLVRVVRGRIFDVAIDLRNGSPTFGSFVSAELSAENGHQLYIPVGYAHGFCTLEDDTEVLYKVSAPYAPAHDCGIRWDDRLINVNWPIDPAVVTVSAKDADLPLFEDVRSPFRYAGGALHSLPLSA